MQYKRNVCGLLPEIIEPQIFIQTNIPFQESLLFDI